ncbi:MAG: peptidase dimerization domain-containing protein [Planctomycetes bacterium]|nr:peptidase dimerization domain-containing protein [Planctomycetota bacterium]
MSSNLDGKVADLAERYRPLGAEILREVVRIPADHVDRPRSEGGDPECGLSNHEGPRLEYLRRRIAEIGAVRRAEDVGFDDYGNLVWTVEDPEDRTPADRKRVVYYDGHSDTVRALRPQWTSKIGGGIDAYLGLVDREQVNRDFLRRELGHIPDEADWTHVVFGRGSADQLGGVVAQVLATKIQVELTREGALRGALVRSYATAAEEDNDGGGPLHLVNRVWPGAPAEWIPDAVILTEGTGDADKGALGIYRGQRGRMQIEVEVTGRSCHGSMPWEGLNPLEHGARILVEAAGRYERLEGFKDDPFLGHGTRTASWAQLDTPSDCAVPDRFTFRFDRRLTLGETPEEALADVERFSAVASARQAGLRVLVRVPRYDRPTWKGQETGNPQFYRGWVTPGDHPVVQAAVAAYRGTVTPRLQERPSGSRKGYLRREPRVDRWIFSTDGVGFHVARAASRIQVPGRKRWVESGDTWHPPMFGVGPGIEQNTHKIGECVDTRELQHCAAVLARFPSALVERG